MEASGRQRRYAAAGSVVLLAGALGYIGLVDPHNSNSLYPPCLFKLLTGWSTCTHSRPRTCSGSRTTRVQSRSKPPPRSSPRRCWVGRCARLSARCRHGDLALPIPVMIAVAVAVIAWTVLRNLPGFPLVPTISG
ncbi:conserved membrane protein [Mycobacterium tuberculosis '98-R604 INH-RIF-EM']|nr:conserved membrane protein [Mycobacterium tuberculosis '98-R604 INH-RIF-EM']